MFPISFVKALTLDADSTTAAEKVFVKRMHKVSALSGATVLILAVWVTYAAVVRGLEYRYCNTRRRCVCEVGNFDARIQVVGYEMPYFPTCTLNSETTQTFNGIQF